MKLVADLVTDFHRELVTAPWLARLGEVLSAHPRLKGLDSGVLVSEYNEDRFMGPQSVVKYRFKVSFPETPESSPLWSGHKVEVEFRPHDGSFKLRTLWWSVYWKDQVDLEGAGIPAFQGLPDISLVRYLDNASARSWGMAPVGHEDKHLLVAFAEPEQIERAADISWQFQTPVRLRTIKPDDLTAILDAVHGPLEPVDYLTLTPGEPLEGEPCERNLFTQGPPTAGLGERYIRLDAGPVIVSVEKVRERISAFFQRREWPGCRVRPVEPEEWDNLCRLTDEDLVWTKLPPGEGERWKLVSTSVTSHRGVRRWTHGAMPDEPFVRCALAVMLAGFEVQVEREVHWV